MAGFLLFFSFFFPIAFPPEPPADISVPREGYFFLRRSVLYPMQKNPQRGPFYARFCFFDWLSAYNSFFIFYPSRFSVFSIAPWGPPFQTFPWGLPYFFCISR